MNTIKEQTQELKPAQNLLSIKGVGIVLMAIVLSEIGDISRFADSKKFVGFAGLAPIEHESGPYKGEKHLKKGGVTRLSYACYMIANCARRYDERLMSSNVIREMPISSSIGLNRVIRWFSDLFSMRT